MALTVASVAMLWGPLLVLTAAVLTYGISRDRGRSTRPAVVAACLAALVLTTTTVLVAWGSFQQQRAEQEACAPSTDC